MLEIRVSDPILREQLRLNPVRFGVQLFFMMVGALALLTAVVDALFGDAPAAMVFRLAIPSLVTSVLMTGLLCRGARKRPSSPGAA